MVEKEQSEVERLEKKEFELATYSGEYEVLPASELRKLAQSKQGRSVVMKSRIPTLDNSMGGFETQETTIIPGPTKGGKTLLARSLTVTFLEQGIDCLWFPYENCGAFGSRFMRDFGDKVPEFLMPKNLKRNALDWLDERIWEAQLKYSNVGAVFVDHLHFLFDMARSKNPSLEIGAIMRQLVGIAQERNVALFLICHMVKAAPDHEPQAGDTRDSGMIECEADNVIAVWRDKSTPNSNKSKLKIIHNRRMGVFDKVIELEKVGPYLREVDKTHEAPKEQPWWNKQ
jgi:replicative DNA helicase